MKRHFEDGRGSGKSQKKQKKKKKKQQSDPSLQYITDPKGCPIVATAEKYFNSLHLPFEVHCGSVHAWRSLAKLAVRGSKELGGKIQRNECIGLFAPSTHEITPCLDSPVHHPSINTAAKFVEEGCILHGNQITEVIVFLPLRTLIATRTSHPTPQ